MYQSFFRVKLSSSVQRHSFALINLAKAKYRYRNTFFGSNRSKYLKYIVFTPLSFRAPIVNKRQMAALPDNKKPSNNSNNNNKNKSSSNNSQSSHKFTNKLANEQSPYLLQHAHNPVNWYPWGEEAFAKAKKEDKPIFLSVGYSTCHWCHVMEHESFENESIADIMNKNFVCIKVDREERPDVDKMYMTYVTATTQHGGWPMSVWLTPSLKPIFGGTYFPREDGHYGQIGFKTILQRISKLWKEDKMEVQVKSERIIAVLKHALVTYEDEEERGASKDKNDEKITEKTVDRVFDALYLYFDNAFDNQLGGFGGAPKFPRPSELNFLLRFYYRNQDTEKGQVALAMATQTLRFMGNGGMFDHLAGGFHRYSVDEFWHVPHFEKMLYDNGQLIVTYLNAYQITKDEFYLKIAQSCLKYVMRDMTDKEYNGIYSAEDADSYDDKKKHKKEGLFYIWSEKEIDEILETTKSLENRIASLIFKHQFFIKSEGNATLSRRSDPHVEFRGKNVLYKRYSLKDTLKFLTDVKGKLEAESKNKNDSADKSDKGDKKAKESVLAILGVDEKNRAAFMGKLDEIKTEDNVEYFLNNGITKLYEYRNNIDTFHRYKPDCDDKIIVAWNGLMISAFSKAHQVINIGINKEKNGDYLNAATKCAQFIYKHMRNNETGHLYRIFRNGVCNNKIEGFSSDYSYLIQGLLDLYEASFDLFYLQWAIELQKIQVELFFDSETKSNDNDNNNDKDKDKDKAMKQNKKNKKRVYGGFYESLSNDKNLLIRQKEEYDGAEPSSTSIAIGNMLRLYKMCNNNEFLKYSHQSLNAFWKQMQDKPMALPQCIVSLDSYVRPSKQIIFSIYDGSMSDELALGDDEEKKSATKDNSSGNNNSINSKDLCKDNPKLRKYCEILFGNYYPDTVLMALDSNNKGDLESINQELKWFDCSVIPRNIKDEATRNGDQISQDDVFAHVCDQFKCNAPTNKVSDLEKLIQAEKTTFESSRL